MDPSQSAKRPRREMDKDELARTLNTAFPDDVERAESIYFEAVDDPGLAKMVLEAVHLSAAKQDLKGVVERAYKDWQAKLAEEAINQREDLAVDLRDHALGLIRTDPAFVDSVLRLPADKNRSLQALAKEVDGEAVFCPEVPGEWLTWAVRSTRHQLLEGCAGQAG